MKQILVFLMLAFLLPSLCAILIMNTVIFHSGVLNLIAYGVEAASPSLAAILTVLHFENCRGLKQFLKKSYIDNLNLKVILISFSLPVLVVGASKLFWLLFGGTSNLGILTPKKMLIICWALIAEELGWRGFLQAKLQIYFSEFTLPLILGIIWAAWHYHYLITGVMSVPILLFTLGCVFDSYVYFALSQSVNGNIIPVSVLHFSENLCFNLFLINPEYNNGSTLPYLLYVICSLVTALIVFSAIHKRSVRMQSINK